MNLVTAILKSVSNSKKLAHYPTTASPFNTLIASYKKLAEGDPSLPDLTEASTGYDLKNALNCLDPYDQLRLLHAYVEPSGPVIPTEDVAAVEERKLRHWIIRFSMATCASLAWLVVGGIVAISIRSGALPEGAIVNSFMSLITEVMRLIFASTH
jgi:hypothetical protein